MPRPRRLSLSQARRVALTAQGFRRPRPQRPITMRDLQAVISQLGQFQIDSINIVTRAHFMPLYSRLGAYDPALLERAAHRPPRRLFEFWGHAASLIDITLQPALRWRMERAAEEAWAGKVRIQRERPDLVARVRREVEQARRPITARQIESEEEHRRDHWGWNWSETKTALEWLFDAGAITSAYRNSQFERAFAIPEKVLPAAIVDQPTPSHEEAVRQLVRRSARALGIGSLTCFADYFRLRTGVVKPAIEELVKSGELAPVQVDGWDRPLWMLAGAPIPRRIGARALLSPFDSLVFERRRLSELFGFDYRIEIYVPEPQRRYGYYVYPFLLGEEFVARVDLKADRSSGRLVVRSAWSEAGHDHDRIATELAIELRALADWLGLSMVDIGPDGDLAPALARAAGPGDPRSTCRT
ncbi:hypothetical protein CLV29_1375 [Naumannella halotolerans]|uniref:Winged helix-turn-helix protein n=1 Tax=Naumannella halotolerans TaxID=993414 RepID=A0A4R7JA05_9ACTN|nr:hypothetical protein CLV29_1375 [Naumannella halotolerans]